MALFIETGVANVIIDAGVSLAPRRYGLPPHPTEFKALKEARERILKYSKQADVVIVSHYHLDHYTPKFKSWYEWSDNEIFEEIYSNKIIFAKDINFKINFNQRKRGFLFSKNVESVCSKLKYVDGKTINIGDLELRFSEPLPHGAEGTKLGYVLVVTISYEGEKIVYAPDVQGPIYSYTLNYIKSQHPRLIIVGGPPTYLSGIKVKKEDVESGLRNLKALFNTFKVIPTHHILRDPSWTQLFKPEELDSIKLYSDFYETKPSLLEANRKKLYRENPPSDEFFKWLRMYKEGFKEQPPPLSD